jgi:hypothetical protein
LCYLPVAVFEKWCLAPYDPHAQHIVIYRDIIRNEEEFPSTSCTIALHLSVLTESEEPLSR